MNDIKQLIEEVNHNARAYCDDTQDRDYTSFMFFSSFIRKKRFNAHVQGQRLILQKWQESSRWRAIADGEYPQIDTDVFLKQVHEDGSIEYDTGYLHTGDSKLFICGLLTKPTHWKPIND